MPCYPRLLRVPFDSLHFFTPHETAIVAKVQQSSQIVTRQHMGRRQTNIARNIAAYWQILNALNRYSGNIFMNFLPVSSPYPSTTNRRRRAQLKSGYCSRLNVCISMTKLRPASNDSPHDTNYLFASSLKHSNSLSFWSSNSSFSGPPVDELDDLG